MLICVNKYLIYSCLHVHLETLSLPIPATVHDAKLDIYVCLVLCNIKHHSYYHVSYPLMDL